MKFHAIHVDTLLKREGGLIIGFTGGRVPYAPEAKYLYSLRIFLLMVRFEILWKTGNK